MRVNAGPDAARTRLHASTLRLDIGAHSFGTAAIVLVVESKRMEPIAQIFFSISLSPRFLPSQIELGRDGLQRRLLQAPKLTQIICPRKVSA
jgi:hypothetical protein